MLFSFTSKTLGLFFRPKQKFCVTPRLFEGLEIKDSPTLASCWSRPGRGRYETVETRQLLLHVERNGDGFVVLLQGHGLRTASAHCEADGVVPAVHIGADGIGLTVVGGRQIVAM